MIEPEIAFCDLADDMQCAEDYVRFCCKFVLENCRWEGHQQAMLATRSRHV